MFQCRGGMDAALKALSYKERVAPKGSGVVEMSDALPPPA